MFQSHYYLYVLNVSWFLRGCVYDLVYIYPHTDIPLSLFSFHYILWFYLYYLSYIVFFFQVFLLDYVLQLVFYLHISYFECGGPLSHVTRPYSQHVLPQLNKYRSFLLHIFFKQIKHRIPTTTQPVIIFFIHISMTKKAVT